ncbi:hypothetical protein [Marinifilum flexuosum]|uniref:hypothetical protein n=1 Tax=Marinifilum flexuosum TaxID=1117708 RepID=UPI002491B361|nr:hypothetical protein [Marinifilum flexuosum]
MTTLLKNSMSSETQITYAERHVRLCQQTNGAESLVSNIQPKIENLEIQIKNRTQKVKARYAAYDAVVLKDSMLDDCIKNLVGSAKQYDRSNPGRPVFNLLFPDGKPSNITNASNSKEVEKAEQLLLRLQSLGEGHSLLSHVDPLTNAIAASRTAIAVHREKQTEEKVAIANEELAQAELRKQYEFNSLDAIKLFGKSYANRLFPKFTSRKKKVEEEMVEETEAPIGEE